MAGLRHRLVHDYEGIQWQVVASIMFDELPRFLEQVEGLLSGDGQAMPIDQRDAE